MCARLQLQRVVQQTCCGITVTKRVTECCTHGERAFKILHGAAFTSIVVCLFLARHLGGKQIKPSHGLLGPRCAPCVDGVCATCAHACATGALITVISEHSRDDLVCRSAGTRGLALSALLALPLTGACIA